MKQISTLLLALAVLISACAPPADETPLPPTPQPATATQAPLLTETPTATPLPVWQPPLNATWQWQLGGDEEINTSFDVDIYDLDLFETEASLVSELHSQGRKAICYISVGSWEEWRPDADAGQLFVRRDRRPGRG